MTNLRRWLDWRRGAYKPRGACVCGHDEVMHVGLVGRCAEPEVVGDAPGWADTCERFRPVEAAR